MSDGRKCVKAVMKVLMFLGIFLLLLLFSSSVLKEKWHKYDSLYELKENSVDYLTAGMSQDYYGISPVYIYDHTGYVGYNLGDEAQNIRFSYFWLVEALKKQKPKAFFLDVGNLFYNESYMNEGWKLKEYSAMPLSREKISATLEGTEDPLTRLGSLYPLGYYHANWKNLTESDYHAAVSSYLGANIRYDTNGSASPVTVNAYREAHEGLQEYTASETISEENRGYFERIVQLCTERGVSLIPIKVPTLNWDEERHGRIEEFLKPYGLPFLDLCEEELINWTSDTIDTGYHLNYWGECKVSDRLGEYMKELFSDSSADAASVGEGAASEDPVLNEIVSRYHQENVTQLLSGILTGAEKREQFFRWLAENKEDNIVILTVRDHLYGDEEEIQRYFRMLGLSDFTQQHRNDSYISILRRGRVTYEKWSSTDKLIFHGALLDSSPDPELEIRSSGKASHLITDDTDLACVKLNGTEYALNKQGLNVVLFGPRHGRLRSSCVVFQDSDYIVNREGETIDYMDRVLADRSGSYRLLLSEGAGREQAVELQFSENGTYFVKDAQGHYLTVEHAGTDTGTKALWERKTGDADQLWMLFPEDGGTFHLRSLYNRLYLEEESGSLYLGEDEEQIVSVGAAAE